MTNAPVALALVDADSLQVRASSPAFAEALGLAPDNIPGRPLAELAGAAFAERIREDGRKLKHSPARLRAFEARLPGSPPRVRPTRITLSLLGGETDLLLLALEEPVPGEAALLDALPDPMLLISRDGTILESWGPGPGGLGGPSLSLQEILAPDSALEFLKAIETALETGATRTVEVIVAAREGSKRLEVRVSPCGTDRVICLAREADGAAPLGDGDILSTMVALSDDVIYSLNLAGELKSWNSAAERIYGYAAAEILGRSIAMLIPPERPDDFRMILEAVRRGEPIRRFETLRRHKSGRRIEVSLSLSPIRNRNGAPTGAAVVTRDLTEINRLQKALMEAAERERRRFGQDLHEGIGQDLTGVALACRALELKLSGRSRESAAELRRIGELLGKTIVKTRTLARGLYPVGLDGEALPEFLREMTQMVEETFWVRCEVEWQAGLRLSGEAEARSLYWIVQEAVMNAVRHGGPKRIRVRAWKDAGGVFVSVWDDGKSLGAEDPNPSGTGLLVMRSRAKAIGAGLTIGNHPDGGVLVECRIPTNEERQS